MRTYLAPFIALRSENTAQGCAPSPPPREPGTGVPGARKKGAGGGRRLRFAAPQVPSGCLRGQSRRKMARRVPSGAARCSELRRDGWRGREGWMERRMEGWRDGERGGWRERGRDGGIEGWMEGQRGGRRAESCRPRPAEPRAQPPDRRCARGAQPASPWGDPPALTVLLRGVAAAGQPGGLQQAPAGLAATLVRLGGHHVARLLQVQQVAHGEVLLAL